jgi:hypothetical protein
MQRRYLIAALVAALAGVGIALLAAQPWDDGGSDEAIGPAATFTHPSRPPAIGNVGGNLPASTLSTAEIAEALAVHNTWRKRYDIAPLRWDAPLASFAQDWATKIAARGALEHRPNDDANPTGENIGMGYPTITAVTDAWGNEVADYNLQAHTCADGKVCGHFTQVVWSTTTTLGCGKASNGDTIYWVCNYKPPGNYTGDNFRTGTRAG